MMVNIRAGDVPDLIRKTAEEFCGEFYDGPRTDKFRHIGITQKAFVRRYWTNYVSSAVAVLSQMLGMDGFDEDEKAKIYDALVSMNMMAREGGVHASLSRWR